MKIVLASASPRRSMLLEQLGLEFSVIPSNAVEEINPLLSPQELAKQLALQKAQEVANRLEEDCLVLGADTIVVLEGQVLGKPENSAQAELMLAKLSGKLHQVMTGIALIDKENRLIKTHCEITEVQMCRISSQEIANYVATGEPMDKAGAYGIQGRGAIFVEKIEGCYSNVVGLPLHRLALILAELGVPVL